MKFNFPFFVTIACSVQGICVQTMRMLNVYFSLRLKFINISGFAFGGFDEMLKQALEERALQDIASSNYISDRDRRNNLMNK